MAHPIARVGTPVLIHDAPSKRTSWAPHGVPGFYLGPAPSHYRCFRVLNITTQHIRISDTLAWLPAPFKMPGSSATELLHAAISDLTAAVTAVGAAPTTEDSRQPVDRSTETLTSSLRAFADLFAPSGGASAGEERVLPATLPTYVLAPATPALQRVPMHTHALPSATPVVPRVHTHTHALPPTTPELQRVPTPTHATTQATPAAQRVPMPTHALLPATPAAQRMPVHPPAPPPKTGDAPRLAPSVPGEPPVPGEPRVPGEGKGQPRRKQPARPQPHHKQPARTYVPRGTASCPLFGHQRFRHRARGASLAHVRSQPPPTAATRELRQQMQHIRQKLPRYTHHPYAFAALNLAPDGRPLTYARAKGGPNAHRWVVAESEEIRRLITSGTLRAIHLSEQPINRRKDTTYYNPQVKEKTAPDGDTTYRVRGAAGGDRIVFPGNVSASTADMEVVKLLAHSVASDRTHKPTGCMSADIKDFYLGTPMERKEYVRIYLKHLPPDVVREFGLDEFIHNDSVLFEIGKCIYGLPQACLLSQVRLVGHFADHGYHQVPCVPCLLKHAERGTTFTLVVDDFLVKYNTEADADHFLDTLRLQYEITVDPTASKYLGYAIAFDDTAHTVTLSMPEYVPKLLQRFAPGRQIKGAAFPAIYTPHTYGAQPPPTTDNSAPLDTAAILRLQEIVGSLLYYARAVDCTMLTAVNHIASEQSRPTQHVMDMAERFLQYAASYPAHEIVYKACDMVLHIQSDASFLSRSKSRSVAGGILYCDNADATASADKQAAAATDTSAPTTPALHKDKCITLPFPINGAIITLSRIIPGVPTSATEAEYAAAYISCKEGVYCRNILIALGYP
jgi:hypothetical protein